MKKLIIDGNNLIHRTFWVAKTQAQKTNLNDINNTNNLHIYFTLNAIFSYVTQFTPTETYVVWDEKPEYRINLRKKEYIDYKDNRSSDTSPHQNNQVIKKILRDVGIPSIFPRDLEADDVISHLCRNYHQNYKNIIISADKDFLQLINEQTALFDPIRKIEYNYETFELKTGFKNTKTWLEAKCLLGDKSDNVEGVPKVTRRKVQKIINNEISLTKDEQEIFDRNYNLFSLYRIDDVEEEKEYYNEQLKQAIQGDWKAFIDECTSRQFNNILKKREAWYSLFFLKNKLQELFT